MYTVLYHGMDVRCDTPEAVRALAGNGVSAPTPRATARQGRKATATKATKATKAKRRGMPPLPAPNMEEVKKLPYISGPIDWPKVKRAMKQMKMGDDVNKTQVRRDLKLRQDMGKDI